MDIDAIEQRVEAMTAEGRRIVTEAIERYKPVAIVAAFSGGDDSIVSTHFLLSQYEGAFAFYADTLVGLSPTRNHIRAVCDRYGWALETGQARAEGPPKLMRSRGKLVPFDAAAVCPAGRWDDGDTAYEEFAINFGFPGRGKPQHARMYQRLKERPIRRMLRRLGATKAKKKVLMISGIRHDESAIRAGYKRETSVGHFGDIWVNPFYYRTAQDFEAYRQEFGLPRNPVKRRCGISGECCCGTFANPGERSAYREADPGFADYLSNLESRVSENGFPWGWGESLPQWWIDQRRGQRFLFDLAPGFQPMCVGCVSGRR